MKPCLGGQAVYSVMHGVCEGWAGSMHVMWGGEQDFSIAVLSSIEGKDGWTVVL